MQIVGCDLHTRYQQIAMLDKETGELIERRGWPTIAFVWQLWVFAAVTVEWGNCMSWFSMIQSVPRNPRRWHSAGSCSISSLVASPRAYAQPGCDGCISVSR